MITNDVFIRLSKNIIVLGHDGSLIDHPHLFRVTTTSVCDRETKL